MPDRWSVPRPCSSCRKSHCGDGTQIAEVKKDLVPEISASTPVVPVGKLPKREDYVVRVDWMHNIVEMIAPRGIWRDLFATAATARFERFEAEAAKADWDAEGIIS